MPTLRENRFLKVITYVVLITFTMWILEPTAVAARVLFDKPSSTAVSPTPAPAPSFSLTLAEIAEHLQLLSHDTPNPGPLKQQLKAWRQTLEELDLRVRQDFADVAKHLQEKQLPAEILQRHEAAVASYRADLQTLLENLTAVEMSDSKTLPAKAQTAWEHLNQQPRKHHAPFDPNHLPFNIPNGQVRVPKETPAELQQLLPAGVKVSANELMPGLLEVATAPGPEYLVETPEVVMTPEIQALATRLEHQPVKIYNWVHDNIQFLPTYGSIQGAAMTLETKQGNAFDTASLLVALLRASGIHARYAYGTVRLPIESVMNWVGGVTKPEAAIQLLAQGGIPVVAQTQGGVIKFAKLEHIWVEAWIDFFPSRGAKHLMGDSWVPLDASFKQYQLTPGMDLPQAVPFNAQALVDHLTQTATINETEGWVSGIDQNYLQTTLQSYQTQLENYLTQTHPDATVGEVLGTQTIIPANRPVLAAGLPYQVVARGNTFATLPATLRHTLTVTLFESVTAQALENPSVTVTLSLPVLRSQRLHLTYVPATAMDAQALAHYQNDPNVTQLPLYLFRVKPVLKLEETVLAEGPAVTLGQPQNYTLTLTDPHQSYPQSGTVQAGDETVFTVNSNGLTLDVLKSRAASSRDTTDVAENLHQLGLLFWFEHDWLDSLAARVYQVRTQRLPSVGVFFMPLTIQYLFGIPKSGYYHTRQIDVRRNVQMVVGETLQARFEFMSHIGIHGSYLEGSVLDQLFGQTWMPGRSTTQVLMEAAQQNIPIYTVTPTNLQTVLPQLSLTADVREEIINAVSTGKTVVIPQRDVTQGRWVGTGYIIQDPVTGAGAYLIEGGYNGGTWEGCTITVQASVYRQGFIYGALSALQDTFEQLQAELTARLKAEMAVSKQLRENRTQVEQLNQLLDLTVKLFVGALTALGVEPLINGNGCLVAKAKRAVDEVYVTNELFVLLDRNPQTDKYEAMVDFTAEGITRCSNYQWEVNPPINVSSNQQSFTHTFTDYNKYTATVTATCQGSTTNLSAKINVTVVKIDIKQNENVITGKMQKEIVGRKVSLVGEVKPDRLIFNSQWDIPERVIKDYKIEVGQNPPDRPSGSPAEYPKSGEKVTLSPDDKHKKMVAFYWIDGGKGVPQTQRVNYSITVPNGSQFVVDTTFEVYKPVLPEIKTEVDIVRLSPRIDIDGKGVNLWLAYGAPDNGGKVGIEFRVDFSKKDPMIPPDFGKGQFQWVQLVKQTEREEVEDEEPQKPGVYNRCWKTYQHDDYRLDSLFPYPGFYDGDIFYTSDSPASGPLSYQLAIERHGEFKMWLMYTPAGVIEGENKNVIPVPLAKVDWRWRAIAWKGDGILWGARSTYEVLLPYQKKPNEPTPSLSDAGPLFQETIEYPTWVTNSNPLYPGRHQSIKFQPEVCPSSSDKR